MRSQSTTGERGASGVEYGLLISGIAAVVVAVIFAFGGFTGTVFGDSCETVRAEVEGACDPAPGD